MKEYIDKDLIIQKLELRLAVTKLCDDNAYKKGQLDARTEDIENIKYIPAADVEPVRHGEWKLLKDGNGICSQCGHWQTKVWCCDNSQRYCGVCGARMDGGNK